VVEQLMKIHRAWGRGRDRQKEKEREIYKVKIP
jgi:hypothetical protein